VKISCISARKKIKRGKQCNLLIDNSVIGHSVTHETAWIKTGRDEDLDCDYGYSARISVHHDDDKSEIASSIRYLPGIYELAKSGWIDFYISNELTDETLNQPEGRYSGYGIFDYSLFKDVPTKLLNDPNYTLVIAPTGSSSPDIGVQRKNRYELYKDPIYIGLVDVLGKKNNQDAFHIFTAEKNGLYGFLTMDFRLIRAIESQKGHPVIKALKTKILSPEQLGKELQLCPISPRAYSYHDSGFFVRNDLNWPDSKRYNRRRNK
jgi:hypothetical protein